MCNFYLFFEISNVQFFIVKELLDISTSYYDWSETYYFSTFEVKHIMIEANE